MRALPIKTLSINEDTTSSSNYEVLYFEITSNSDNTILPSTNQKWHWKKVQ
jgi:hypothetical protein